MAKSRPERPLRPATLLVRGGLMRSDFDETSETMYLTSGFVYDSAAQAEATFNGTAQHYQYSRFGNPTVGMLEGRIAALEGAEACRATATGMAAVHAAMLSHLKTGDRVVASRALFGSCHWIVSTLLPRYGIATEFVDGADLDQWEAALSKPAFFSFFAAAVEAMPLRHTSATGDCRAPASSLASGSNWLGTMLRLPGRWPFSKSAIADRSTTSAPPWLSRPVSSAGLIAL